MIQWDEELEAIFDDPLLADIKPPKKKPTSSDKLIGGFQRIMEFVETNHRLPQESDEREERTLYNQLQGILKDPEKRKRCLPYDTEGVLQREEGIVASETEVAYAAKPKSEEQELDDILNDPLFDDVTGDAGLFDLPDYMKRKLEERREADYIAQRVECEDFSVYEPGFKEVHAGLKSGKYRLIKFKGDHVLPGRYFVEDGMLVYLAAIDELTVNRHGKRDARTRCIYENGMESGIYRLTLCKNLYTSGYTVQNVSGVANDFLKKTFTVDETDVESGLIYVLASKSTNPAIAGIKNLYKIGFTTTPLEARIAHAKKEPTYLCADVETVATWRVYNVKSSTVEALIHKLFDCVQLQVKVDGRVPKEWFVVPLHIIEQSIAYIVNRRPVVYDKDLQQLIDMGA
jgi:hypothetical protein